MSKYGERPTHNLAIKATGIGTAEILLNGQDIASALTDLTLTMGVGKVPTATLDLLLIDTTQIQDAETRILIPDATRDLLVTLGWTPPGEKAAPEPEDHGTVVLEVGEQPPTPEPTP